MKEKTYYINISTNYKIDFDDIDKKRYLIIFTNNNDKIKT